MKLFYEFDADVLQRHITETQQYFKTNYIEVFVFPQIWGNTAAGNDSPGGVYGDAFTTTHTFVLYVVPRKIALVVNAGDKEVSYMVDNPTKAFWDDVRSGSTRTKYNVRKEPSYGFIVDENSLPEENNG